MSSQAIPEPMNSSPHHSKVKVSITLSDPTFVAGAHVTGKLEMECRADKGLGIGIMMVELFAAQELTSRDHSATSTFLHSRRLFQGPGLPPSNAVQAYPQPGDPHLPQHYHQARRGHSTFLFRVPIPASSPSSISFGSGLAKVRYEIRGSVGVFWKNEKRLIVDKHPVEVVASYPYEETYLGRVPEGMVVAENGKLWMQGKMVGSVIIAGGSACLELQVKNHSNRKNSGLTLTLTRTLYLPGSGVGQQRSAPVQISDTLTTVPFRGPEYIIPPGAEGVANLVFDVPKHARGVRGGTLDGEETGETGPRHSESLFEIKCKVEVKLTMGMGSKDVLLEIPVEVVHPSAIPAPEAQPGPYAQVYPAPETIAFPTHYPDYNPYYPAPPISPPPQMPYVDPTHNEVWLPPPIPASEAYPYDPYQTPMAPLLLPYAVQQQPYFHTPTPPQDPLIPLGYIPRPSSAGPVVSASQVPPPMVDGMPALLPPSSLLPLQLNHHPATLEPFVPEEGKGEVASRIAQHLRFSSRNRSVSPLSHRYPLPIFSGVPESSGIATTTGVSQPRRIARILPLPPGLSRVENFSLSPPGENAVVHSPRPQLTPKHSFTRDSVLGTTSKSERVEELEKMADVVVSKSQDLSCDLPRGISHILQSTSSKEKDKAKEESKPSREDEADADTNANKTLPGPPVPSGKNIFTPLTLPNRPRADLYFSSQGEEVGPSSMPQTPPLAFDQTPPTPALLAILPPRPLLRPTDKCSNLKTELQTENGLDALERRLLAEVGTRKLDPWPGTSSKESKPKRPDIRGVMSPIDTSAASTGAFSGGKSSMPIQMPVKSPEPLHDSAISSLTLAGGLGGDDSDGEFDGRTHRAGSRSRSIGGSSPHNVGRDGLGTGLHLHMRQRAEIGTPTTSANRGRERGRIRVEKDKQEEKEKTKEGKTSGKKKDRLSNKTAAKGRVAAWLGGIDPGVPPQEQIIPPSPSVLHVPHSPFDNIDNDQDDEVFPVADLRLGTELPTTIRSEIEPTKDVAASPNPRSSGFVSITTLKRDTLQARPLITRDATVVEEARRIQDIWSSQPSPVMQQTPPQFPRPTASPAAPVSMGTDRGVSPASFKPSKPQMPLSYSAAARNVLKLPDTAKARASPPPPPPNKPPVVVPPIRPPGVGRVNVVFPPPKPIDPEVRYDIRSARGGRGGRVTSVANLWSSGAITNSGIKGKEVQRQENPLVETKTPVPPPKPLTSEKKLFSAAVMTPAPPRKQTPVASSSIVGAAKPTEAQKRPDSRVAFSVSKHTSPPSSSAPRKIPSATAPSTTVQRSVGKATRSTEALVQKRPATSMSNPYSLHGKTTPTALSTPALDTPKLHAFAVNRGVKPVVKGTFDPAVVSSSHAVPHLSSTASLARPPGGPQISGVQKRYPNQPPRPVKLPTMLSTTHPSSSLASGMPSEAHRPVSPSKPTDLAFGQARLRDLIKKYQGQGQRT